MSKRRRNILLCVGGLMVGGVVYILFRENAYISELFNELPLILFIRSALGSRIGIWISFYLPDCLWGFSLACGIQAICQPKRGGLFISAFTAFVCGLIWELLQWGNLVSGTGDLWDVLMYFLGSTLTIFINIKERKHEEA